MRRAAAHVLVTAALAALAGCSSHEERFESQVPPPPSRAVTSERLGEAAAELALARRDDLERLPADAIAPLAQAAAISFRATGAPGMRNLARSYAEVLLDARVPVGDGIAFFGSERPGVADPAVTALAADALVDVYVATREQRFRGALLAAVDALRTRRLGWRARGEVAGVTLPGEEGIDIAATAAAARVLQRASDPIVGAPSRADARRALSLVKAEQVALGRWYARAGSETPMSLQEWATTLFVLAEAGDEEAVGAVGGGFPAMFDLAFTAEGSPEPDGLSDPDGGGAAWAISAAAAFADTGYLERLAGSALEKRRPDGSVGWAPAEAHTAQARFALGFARAALRLRARPDGSG